MIIGGNAKLIMCFCVNLIENRTQTYAMANVCDSSSPTLMGFRCPIQGPKSQHFTWNFERQSPNIHPSNLQHPEQMGGSASWMTDSSLQGTWGYIQLMTKANQFAKKTILGTVPCPL